MPDVTIHGLASCDTCRKARKALPDAAFRDLRADPPGADEVAGWLAAVGPVLVNRASTTWRGLSEAERTLDALQLLSRHPTLIKRPVISAGNTLHIGWTPAVRKALGLDA